MATVLVNNAIPKRHYYLGYCNKLQMSIIKSEIVHGNVCNVSITEKPVERQAPEDVKSLQRIYDKYFINNNCSELLAFLNKYSAIDAILFSGSSEIVVEYKNRHTSIETYPSVL